MNIENQRAVAVRRSPRRFDADPVARAKAYATEIVGPIEMELDGRANPADCFSWDLIDEGDARGLRTLCPSRKHGGEEIDLPTFIRTSVEIARGDLGIAGMLVQTNRVAMIFEKAGTASQVEKYVPDICADPRCLLAFAASEPTVGSDASHPGSGPNAARYHTKAFRRDGGWEITGKKIYIDNGTTAKFYLVLAQTDDSLPLSHGATCFIVERGTEGLRPGEVLNKTGERLAAHAEVNFDRCWVPDANVMGDINGSHALLSMFTASRNVTAAATAIGVAEAAYDCATAWANSRVQGGRKLIDHGAVRIDLARQRMMIDVARAYVEMAAATVESGQAFSKTLGVYPKIIAGQAAMDMATFAVDLYGARGYTRGWRVEKLMRDASSFLHAGGPNRTLLLKAARMLYGEQRFGLEQMIQAPPYE
jgi:alkylation response protein AidB-like acyl-CoA dehydrogenase